MPRPGPRGRRRPAGAVPNTSTPSPMWWPTTPPRGPVRRCPTCSPTWMPPRWWRTGWPPPEVTVAHDRVQILTVHAAKGLEWQVVAVPHLSGRVFPVDGIDANVAHRRRRPAAAAARRPRHPGPTRRPGARHIRRERSETVVGQDIRAQAQARSAPRRRGTPAAVRGAHPRRGHPAAVRSPLGRVRDQAARAVGVPLRAQGDHRRLGRRGRPVRRRRTLGARAGRR